MACACLITILNLLYLPAVFSENYKILFPNPDSTILSTENEEQLITSNLTFFHDFESHNVEAFECEKISNHECQIQSPQGTNELYGIWTSENYIVYFDEAPRPVRDFQHRCSQKIWKKWAEENNCEETIPILMIRSASNADSSSEPSWQPRMSTYSPRSMSDVGLTRFTIEGSDLIPPHIDALSDGYIKILFIHRDLENTIFECQMDSFVIKSSPNKLVCTQPENMPKGIYRVRPKLYDQEDKEMKWINEINSDGLKDCGWCEINIYEGANGGPHTKFYGNRYVNGHRESSDEWIQWSEWIDTNTAGEGDSPSDQDDETYQSVMSKGFRKSHGICDYPIDIQVRRVSDKKIIEEIPGAIAEKYDVWEFFQIFVADQVNPSNLTQVTQTDNFEFRVLCDPDGLYMFGYYKDQSISLRENLMDNLVGTNPPDLLAAEGAPGTGPYEEMHVGTCNFKYNNLDYPNTLGNEDNTWDDKLVCHVNAQSNFIGPAVLRVTNDKTHQWTSNGGYSEEYVHFSV